MKDHLVKAENGILELIRGFNIESSLKINIDIIAEGLTSYRYNDAAHLADHIYYVVKHGVALAERNGLNDRDARNVLLACFGHDLGCRYERKYHHVLSAGLLVQLIKSNDLVNEYSEKDLQAITVATLEHRASYEGKRDTLVSRLVAVADRGTPDINVFINRTLKFNLDKPGITKEEIYTNALTHLVEKFHPVTGYAWNNYPDEGKDYFKDAFDPLFNILEKPDVLEGILVERLETLWNLKHSSQ